MYLHDNVDMVRGTARFLSETGITGTFLEGEFKIDTHRTSGEPGVSLNPSLYQQVAIPNIVVVETHSSLA
jgi:hypothetical protein